MPIYEFRCLKCDQKFEKLFISNIAPEVVCPACGSEETEKEYSTFASGNDSRRSTEDNTSGGHSGMG